MSQRTSPPRMLREVIRRCLPPEDRQAVVRDLDELYASRLARDGRPAAAAWYARQAAGFVLRVGTTRAAEAIDGIASYRTDAALALRYFRRRPSFALAAVLTLGMGTGGLVTVYSAAEWLLLRPVPGVGGEDALMTLRLGSSEAPAHVSWDVSHPDLLTLRERLPVGRALAGRSPIDVDLAPEGHAARRVAGELVTSNYFDVLRHPLAAGRGFLQEDERLGVRSALTVLSYPLARALHGDPARAVGTDVRLNGTVFRVVGVTGTGFRGADLPGGADLWLPLGALTLVDPAASVGGRDPRGLGVWRRMIVRVGPDVSPGQVTAAANGVMEAARREYRVHSYGARHFTFKVSSGIGLDPSVRATVTRTLGLLAGAAGFLLCLAVANLVNLALMESATRAPAMAVRAALGSSRARMLRALLVEVALLALGGTAVAVALASLWSRWFQDTQLTEYGGALAGMYVSGPVVLVSALAVAVAALIALFRPSAVRRAHSLESLLHRGRAGTPAGQRLRMTLVGVQVAVTLLLLVSAGLLTGSVNNLRRIDLGFAPDHLLVFSVDPHLHGYESARLDQLARELESRLGAESSIRAAGFVSPSPLRSSYHTGALFGSDDPAVPPLVGAGYYVTPGFLTALGAEVIAGDGVWSAQEGTVVLTQGALEELFPGLSPQDALGRMVPTRRRGGMPVRIAAIIEDLRLSDIASDPPPTFFRPLAERPRGLSLTGFASTLEAPLPVAPLVRRVVQARAPELPVFDIRTARTAVDVQFAEVRAMALVARTLSAIGVLLAAVGLYGVLANAVTARRREIGIRSALGAAPGRLLARVLLSGAVPVTAGILAGTAGAAAVGRLLAQHLFGLTPLNPGAYATAVAVVLAITVAACASPAYRASTVSPASVLREE